MNNYFFTFPKKYQIDVGTVIDDAVKMFSVNNQETLDIIKKTAIKSIQLIDRTLSAIPWIVFIIIIVFLGYKISKKLVTGIVYGAMLFFIGSCGLWDKMIETISLVMVAVFISLLLGFPIGILISMNKRADGFLRPMLDLMQTMPSFVYLVPAVILFSTGTMPALLATVIYSVVPMIRMTSLGITNVDKEVKEAAIAFGSTRLQALFKVQIPQAKASIMTGVNQTIMMAMSMVVTSAIIGAKGLGMEILLATNRVEMGKALLPGISIVIIAIILDRLTQGITKRNEVAE